MANKKKKLSTLEQWLADQELKNGLAVTHLIKQIAESNFSTLGHALAHKEQSKEFFIEFFAQSNILLSQEDFVAASLDEIKKELVNAFNFQAAKHEKEMKRQERLKELAEIHTINRNLSQVIDIEQVHIPSNIIRFAPLSKTG